MCMRQGMEKVGIKAGRVLSAVMNARARARARSHEGGRNEVSCLSDASM
jgi:hypothetical protein